MSSFKSYLKAVWSFSIVPKNSAFKPSRYVDLAPTSDADEGGIYARALAFATNNANVFNIALTGPYGSGKSSIVKSFLKRYRGKHLTISLASFLPDAESDKPEVNRQEIERSILQQMLFGQDADKLPLSRFKRIQKPKRTAPLMSLLILAGCFSAWHLFQNRAEIASGTFFTPIGLENWLNYLTFLIGFLFLWRVLHQLYVKSLGVSVKSISLKDVEMSTDEADKESILNRHLDEIIYFFQSTKYDLVIIEDLDRFEEPAIFVTLREINGLINANRGVTRRVRFLYALRDDMFVNKDRTKFFEFIVPVVPIINASNSIDKVLVEGKRLQLDTRLNPQFLREVSRYLSDLRLIKNIFNEYATYIDNLEREEKGVLDPNKLLAVLIYKNSMPEDFESLHQQKGKIATVLQRYDECVASVEMDHKAAIRKIEAEIAEAEEQHPRDLKELRRVYAMAILDRLQNNYSIVRIRNVDIHPHSLTDHELLEEIIETPVVQQRSIQGHQSELNLSTLQHDVDARRSYKERKKLIERKSSEHREGAARSIQKQKDQIASLRRSKFSTIIQACADKLEDDLAGLGESRDLIQYLLFEGYLDDTYYQYISLFHSGRLSPSDNKFLIQIRSFKTPDPDFQINNPAEVIAEMREEDFERGYALNRHLIDHMLENASEHKVRLEQAMKFIARNFENSQDFFDTFYTNGRQISQLITELVKHWPGLADAAVNVPNAPFHIVHLVNFLPTKTLTDTIGRAGIVSGYLDECLVDVLNTGIDLDLGRLRTLGVEAARLVDLADHHAAAKFIVENALYRISNDNIHYIIALNANATTLADLETRNFSTIREFGPKQLQDRIEQNFSTYLTDIVLPLQENTRESKDAIVLVLERDDVDEGILIEFLVKQDAVFEKLNEVPTRFYSTLVEHNMVEPKWKNLIHYTGLKDYSSELMTTFMQDSSNKNALLADHYENNGDSITLSRFVLKNEEFSDAELRGYLKIVPVMFTSFPKKENVSRRQIMVEEGVIGFNDDTFGAASEEDELLIALLVRHIDAYLAKKSDYSVEDRILVALLKEDISDAQKLEIARDINASSVATDPQIAAVVGPTLDRFDLEFKDFDFEYLKSIITNSSPTRVQISLFNKCHSTLSEGQVRQIIESLPPPYSSIAEYWVHPKIENTEQNRVLAGWLEERDIISSWRLSYLDNIRINTFRRARSES